MSSFSGPLTEELQCSICLDVFTDPVTAPCGHNFCKTCLNKYWDNSQTCNCPYCKETFNQPRQQAVSAQTHYIAVWERPDLKINITLRELVDRYKKKCLVKNHVADIKKHKRTDPTQRRKTQKDVQQLIQEKKSRIFKTSNTQQKSEK
ncbi:hypothetical protein cypCar_00048132 [Cyprinus carpio]|nr:hypothetical protein cypCar_00048132 [Cyprinus carpio]